MTVPCDSGPVLGQTRTGHHRGSKWFHFLSVIFLLGKEAVPCDSGPVGIQTQSVVQSLPVFGSVWFLHHVYKDAVLQRWLPQFNLVFPPATTNSNPKPKSSV